MIRLILSVGFGLVIAVVIVLAGDMLSQSLAASAGPTPIDETDRGAMQAYMAGLPTVVFVVMLATWTTAALVAAVFAARFGRHGAWPGWVAGGLFLFLTAANLLLIPHPGWVAITGVVLVVAAVWFGAKAGSSGVARA
jgi:hypothetical protein